MRYGGNANPARALTREMSEELMLPDAFRSYLKLLASTACPERALMALMSLELTARELFTSPTRKPIDSGAVLSMPFTLFSVSVTRVLLGMLASVTRTVLPTNVDVAVPVGVTRAVPAALIRCGN